MGMSREEQRAAAERILAKEPLTEEEREWAEFYKRAPGSYVVPTSEGIRTCGVCGAQFKDKPLKNGNPGEIESALQQFSDHWAQEHQSTGGQWTEAYQKIQEGKSRLSTERSMLRTGRDAHAVAGEKDEGERG